MRARVCVCHVQVKRGDCVFDPFAGTGSVALAAAARGAIVFASDIDIKVLRGKQGRTMVRVRLRARWAPDAKEGKY
jgi:tRNA G10  N-methylase Trm11